MFKAVASYDSGLHLMLMSRSDNAPALALGAEYEVPLWFEAFTDRAYDRSGNLLPRTRLGAVHTEADVIVRQAMTLAREERLAAFDGRYLRLQVDTLCVHGDNDGSIAAVRSIRQALDEAFPS
ncbi:LamB/YcsF family protein [compost metagenome]